MQSSANKSPQKDQGEKVIHIHTCHDCKNHRANTWHDESKYEANYNAVKAEIEALLPDVTVLKQQSDPPLLGAFEIYHGQQPIFSKRNSGLWPNAKAVAQRVKSYFQDKASGKDVTHYGRGPEKAMPAVKKPPAEKKAYTNVSELAFINGKVVKIKDLQKSASPQKEGGESDNKQEAIGEPDEDEKAKQDSPVKDEKLTESKVVQEQPPAQNVEKPAQKEPEPTTTQEPQPVSAKEEPQSAASQEPNSAASKDQAPESAEVKPAEAQSATENKEPESGIKEPQSGTNNEPQSAASQEPGSGAGVSKENEPQSAEAKPSEEPQPEKDKEGEYKEDFNN